jgi:hypothetical protein
MTIIHRVHAWRVRDANVPLKSCRKRRMWAGDESGGRQAMKVVEAKEKCDT